MIKLDHKEIIKKLDEMNEWSDFADDCRHAQENVPSIPPLLSICKITKGTCAFDVCPLSGVKEMSVFKQERPDWCPHKDCQFLRRVCNDICGGKLSEPAPHGGGFNTHRFCLNGVLPSNEVFDLQVNKTDLNWLRWVFDALDGKKTSHLSLSVKIQEINQQLLKLDADNPEYHRLHGYLAALSDISCARTHKEGE